MTASLIIRTLGERPGLLRRATLSALGQRGVDVEVIVVGDGNNPETHLGSMNDNRLRLLKAPRHGRSATGNAGLTVARGDVIGFLDDDDELLPDHVRILTAALNEAPDAVAAYGRAERLEVLSNGNTHRVQRRHVDPYKPYSHAALWLRNLMPIQSMLFRSRLFGEYGGLDPALDALEDWDLWIRYAQAGKFFAVPDITSRYAIPADKRAFRARAELHSLALKQLRKKHANLTAPMSFSDLQHLLVHIDDLTTARHCLRRLWQRLWLGT
jgi:glycosyltransferase involved in cell wall biosynthesis